jgi:hypothetical protein
MTLAEASTALGTPIVVDPNLFPGPICLAAVITGDPYSPTFFVKTDADTSATRVIPSVPSRPGIGEALTGATDAFPNRPVGR